MKHVQRILTNLVDNAIKFTPEGGKIGLTLMESSEPGWLEIVVWDTGIGIPKDKQERLFEPFVQMDAGLSRRYGGTGLGLALIGRLARLQGLEVEVDSEEGEGSRFTVRIARKVPHRVEVFADLRCPFCFALNEWVGESNLTHTVRWRGVEQRPGLTTEDSHSAAIQEEMEEELDRLRDMAPNIRVEIPPVVSNTRRALAALLRIEQKHSWRVGEARTRLYRSIWWEGKDITEWEAIRAVLSDFALDDLDDDSPEMGLVVEATNEWRSTDVNRIPLLTGRDGGGVWEGLGQRVELIRFLDQQLGGPLASFDDVR
jgi:predicted DsbA family dithiol-disulfide isomerase/anti-sigma regulatory factor (Ser/Thr protein kinase)